MLCNNLTRTQSNSLYLDVMRSSDTRAMRRLCKEDLFFLLTTGFKRRDLNRQWLYERCREVERNPNGHLDLWAREHYKSTIITFALSIQDILDSHSKQDSPIRWEKEVTIGIFSHTRPIAKGFLEQIKRELETNTFLMDLFPDVLYHEPRRESSKWSLDGGLLVKRESNPKEATVEAWGLVDGQPTSKHFDILVYDDVVTRESVTTPEQISKTTSAWELSLNLGAEGGVERYIGTRYHFNDTYRTLMERESAKPRIYPATDTGDMEGEPVLLSMEALLKKRAAMGPYTFGCQMLQNPVADKAMSFKQEWLMFYEQLRNFGDWNFYLICDPAHEKKECNDSTVMVVIGLAPDGNYYLVDGLRDRLNLTERANKYIGFHRKWKPVVSGYEKYGKDSDIEHIEYEMEQQNYRFNIIPLGGNVKKNDRIRKLVPIFETNRFWLPPELMYVDNEKNLRDFVKEFIADEYLAFPVLIHDDMLDAIARILDPDLKAVFPEEEKHLLNSTSRADVDKVQTEYELFA